MNKTQTTSKTFLRLYASTKKGCLHTPHSTVSTPEVGTCTCNQRAQWQPHDVSNQHTQSTSPSYCLPYKHPSLLAGWNKPNRELAANTETPNNDMCIIPQLIGMTPGTIAKTQTSPSNSNSRYPEKYFWIIPQRSTIHTLCHTNRYTLSSLSPQPPSPPAQPILPALLHASAQCRWDTPPPSWLGQPELGTPPHPAPPTAACCSWLTPRPWHSRRTRIRRTSPPGCP